MTVPSRLHLHVQRTAAAVCALACAPLPGAPPDTKAIAGHLAQVRAAETRLLFDNATTGIIASVVIASLLAYFEWDPTSPRAPALWFLMMLAVSAGRYLLVRHYWRRAPGLDASAWWSTAFVVSTGVAAAAWGSTTWVFYPPTPPAHETLLIFVIGGIMLGGASLLAARPEAFLTFLLPIGLLTTLRLGISGGQDHVLMAAMAAVFTMAVVATTWRFHRMIAASLHLRFDNQDLIDSLQAAKTQADALNRELELRVAERTAQLVEADRRKDEFLATLAHELRNPLAPIRFALEHLKGGVPAATAARARDVIDRQVRQLVRLVDDLLDVSRITASKLVLRREAHDLSRLMAMAVESIAPLAAAADHLLTVETPATPLQVHGDGARLVQVFANILNNAVKFTPRGGRISFTAGEEPDGMAVVRICDTGVGIAGEVLPRVFDLFQQAEPILERHTGGLGIGLTLARRLVEMHEGRITVHSAGPGRGTEVEIHLPLARGAITQPPAARLQDAPATRPLRVLIVEDHPDAAEMLNAAVLLRGHTTRLAQDGATAIDLAVQFAPDLVLLDIGLPVMNGYLVARALRDRPEFDHVHLAAVTGWGQEEDRRKAREAGFDSHFTKPLAPAALDQLLAMAARGRQPHDPNSSPRTRHTDSGSAAT